MKRRTNTVRRMLPEDLPKIAQIEKDTYASPWDLEYFKIVLDKSKCYVVTSDKIIVGFVIYEFAGRTVFLNNITIDINHRRKGLGKKLISRLKMSQLVSEKTKIQVILQETFLGAQLFLKSMDFIHIKTLPNFFDDIKRDAYVMQFNRDRKVTLSNRVGGYYNSEKSEANDVDNSPE